MILDILKGFNLWSVAFRLVLAALLGGCIGLERGRHGRAAGLRTHILVCLGSTVTALLGLYAVNTLGLGSDPMRISAQVISGIGFLGAGTIINNNNSHVTGLTTAAGLWTTACLGLAIGMGFYWAVLITFVIMLVTIGLLIRAEKTIREPVAQTLYIELSDIQAVKDLSRQTAAERDALQLIPAKSGLPGHVGLLYTPEGDRPLDLCIQTLESQKDVVLVLPVTQKN